MIDPRLEEAKSSIDGYTLPCGFLDSDDELHTGVVVSEMTGEEEEILAARNMPVGKKINKILIHCTESIGPYNGDTVQKIIPEMTQGDRIFLLLAIRRASLGDEMPFVSKCRSCDQEARLMVDH